MARTKPTASVTAGLAFGCLAAGEEMLPEVQTRAEREDKPAARLSTCAGLLRTASALLQCAGRERLTTSMPAGRLLSNHTQVSGYQGSHAKAEREELKSGRHGACTCPQTQPLAPRATQTGAAAYMHALVHRAFVKSPLQPFVKARVTLHWRREPYSRLHLESVFSGG